MKWVRTVKTNLFSEICNLISLKQEGEYWDYKKEWYHTEKKTDFLHDIICMANNLVNRDAYIIIGIDEENDYSLCDVSDDPNRKSTQNVVDFLRDKPFAGNIRPIVQIETLKIQAKSIDIIVIKNSYNSPFYLTNRVNELCANNIYTRVMDTNTPKDKSADLINVEYLWKKRFRLISTPIEKVKYYLENPKDWLYSPNDNGSSKKYYKFHPEYTIEYSLDFDTKGYEYYLFNQMDNRPRWADIKIFFHQTQLEYLQGASLDGGRYFTPVPNMDGISLTGHGWDISYRYFIKDSLEYTVHQFFYNPDGMSGEERIAHDKFMDCIIVFNTNKEKIEFENYVLVEWSNKSEYENDIHLPHFPHLEGYVDGAFEKEYKDVQILKRIFDKFKINNYSK